ncbi:permease-like cell division protein FtsX [uncultured Fusobacterium sp.]|jgi:cell division transport system permease protein|uniref:cell division protein FtsX n=1 Tax=uncultured Fusobacterium sp. TaxID=159267 RepID=UPI002805237F|nr:permease-like cell division protein FtsX [uncultured Fusobacterium sp.]
MNNNLMMRVERNSYTKHRTKIKKKTFILLVISFIILNFFLSVLINISSMNKKIDNSYFFTADLKSELKEEEKNKIEVEILGLEGVRKVRYLSKEEAFKNLQTQLDVAIPKGENPLSDSLLIYFNSLDDAEKLQENLENNQNIKEIFVDAAFIGYQEREKKFYNLLFAMIMIFLVAPSILGIYYTFYNAVAIDFLNYNDIIPDDRINSKRAKKVNLLPFTGAALMGTLIFFNVYTYFREEIIEISSKYLILSIGEIFVVQVLAIIAINMIIWINPLRLRVLLREDS